jgi:hypothetical protein
MSDDLQTLLRPLREVEPTSDELARARAAFHDQRLDRFDPPLTASRRRFRPRPFRPRWFAVLAAASLTIAVVVASLPAGDDDSLRSALRAAAAAAASDAPVAAPFTGYRHIVERVRYEQAGSAPREVRHEVWIDAQWRGVERTDAGDGTPSETTPLVDRAGPFGQAPLAELPTDPDALLRALNAAYDDGSYAAPAAAWMEQPKRDADGRRAEMALSTAWLIAESNATPELRAAGFGVLERLGGARDLGTVRDAEGRAGRGLEITWGGVLPQGDRWSSTMRLIFDSATGEILSVRVSGNVGEERNTSERTYLLTEQTQSIPPGVRRAD